MKLYRVKEDGFIAGTYYKAGAEEAFDPTAVKFLVEPYGNRLEAVIDKPKSAPKPPATAKASKD